MWVDLEHPAEEVHKASRVDTAVGTGVIPCHYTSNTGKEGPCCEQW